MLLRVKELREAKGWNQTVLAYHAGLSPSQVSLIETGKRNPSATTLKGIADALGVEVGDLFPKAQAPLPLEEAAGAVQQPAETSPHIPSHDERKEELIKSPSFWAAQEKTEARLKAAVSEPLTSYIKSRAKMYEEELEDPNSPHFRTAAAAALWAEAVHREAAMFTRLGLEEAKLLSKDRSDWSSAEVGWAAVEGLKHIANRASPFGELRKRADERIASMHHQPDALEQKRYEKARQEAEESERRFGELREAPGL